MRWLVSLLTLGLLAAVPSAATPVVSVALFGDSRTDPVATFVAASFSPGSTPTPTATLNGSTIRIQWGSVSSGGDHPVAYTLRRSGSDGSNATVCLGSGAIVDSGSTATCDDTTATDGVTYVYTVQPTLRFAGAVTWVGAISVPSNPVTVARVRFAGVGNLVTSTVAGAITVPYPAGTRVGDLLVITMEVGRNKAPTPPPGWNVLASRSVVGNEDFHLFVAWRIADGATTVAVDVDARNGGAAARIARYEVPTGASSPTVAVANGQDASTTAASSTLTPTPALAPTSPALAISVVAIRGTATLDLVMSPGWNLRSFDSVVPATSALGFALADYTSVTTVTIPSPTWRQTGVASRWIYAGSAFG